MNIAGLFSFNVFTLFSKMLPKGLTSILAVVMAMIHSVPLLSQNNTTQTPKLLIGVSVSPDICFRTLTNNNNNANNDWIINSRNDRESPKFSYSTGFSVCYNKTSHWGIETGLQYSNKGYSTVFADLKFGDVIDPQYGFISSLKGPITEIIIIDNLHYLDIPMRAIYILGNRNLRFVSSLGITTNFLLKATHTTLINYTDGDIDRNKQKQTEEYKRVNFSPTVSIGMDWQIKNKLKLRIEPTFRYGIRKIIDTPITAYLWSGGLNLSCYYVLK